MIEMNSLSEFVGQKYGNLTIKQIVEFKHGISCICVCKCGVEIRVGLQRLLSKHKSSCGCISNANIVGEKFGRLTVISKTDKRKDNRCVWLCDCVCGKQVEVNTSRLRDGSTVSCGCYRKEIIGSLVGDKHPNWKGGITTLNERIKKLPEYDNWRNKVFERDGYNCFLCKKSNKLQSHHIKFFSSILKEEKIDSIDKALNSKMLWDVNNGISLCKNCHKKVHNCKKYKYVWKPWGVEWWITNNEFYCYKRIFIRKGFRTSFQYHEQKVETNYLIYGLAKLWIENNDGGIDCFLMFPNDFIHIDPPKKHRIEAITDIILMESSSPHVNDVIRIEDDTGRANGYVESEHINSYGRQKVVDPNYPTIVCEHNAK